MGYNRMDIIQTARVTGEQLEALLRALGRSELICTIKGVEPTHYEGRPGKQPEVVWDIDLQEFDKPVKLNRMNAEMLFGTLGEDTDEWIGRRISVRTVRRMVYDKLQPVIEMEGAHSGATPTLSPRTNVGQLISQARDGRIAGVIAGGAGGGQAPAQIADARPMGFEVAARCLLRLRERGKAWSDFVKYMRQIGDGRADGCEIHEAPMGVCDEVKRFCAAIPLIEGSEAVTDAAVLKLADELRARAEPPAAVIDGQAVDRSTGEVLGGSPPIDDDIPF